MFLNLIRTRIDISLPMRFMRHRRVAIVVVVVHESFPIQMRYIVAAAAAAAANERL